MYTQRYKMNKKIWDEQAFNTEMSDGLWIVRVICAFIFLGGVIINVLSSQWFATFLSFVIFGICIFAIIEHIPQSNEQYLKHMLSLKSNRQFEIFIHLLDNEFHVQTTSGTNKTFKYRDITSIKESRNLITIITNQNLSVSFHKKELKKDMCKTIKKFLEEKMIVSN